MSARQRSPLAHSEIRFHARFFFSSRRRHTRFDCDWSSDVCSSDLPVQARAVATAFACTGRPLDEMFCQEAVMTLGSVPLAGYATTGTDEVAASLTPLVPNHDAILLANHGAVTYGRDLIDAFLKMETLEHLAQIRLAAHQLGCVRTLEEEQAARLLRAKERYAQRSLM